MWHYHMASASCLLYMQYTCWQHLAADKKNTQKYQSSMKISPAIYFSCSYHTQKLDLLHTRLHIILVVFDLFLDTLVQVSEVYVQHSKTS